MSEVNGNTVVGTYRAGRVELDQPVDWPDGARVSISPGDEHSTPLGISEADWPDTPETRRALVAKFDEIEPLEFTPEEEADLVAWRAEVKRVTIDAVKRQMGL